MVLMSVFSVSASFAEGSKVGMLERLNITADEFQKMIEDSDNVTVISGTGGHSKFVFYKSVNEMVMALNAGEIDEILLPEASAEYVLNLHPEYIISCVVIARKAPVLLSLGFTADNPELAKAFNKTINEMKSDGTLINLQGKYIMGLNTAMMGEMAISDPTTNVPDPVVFRKFDGAKEIKVAVTGDLPPIDYIDPNGSPEGFNAAILAEICGRLGVNVKLINIDSGARASMLASGRADAVFWFEHRRGSEGPMYDVPKGVILSEPYYEFDTFYHLKPAE